MRRTCGAGQTARFYPPAHRTGLADLPHPALGQDVISCLRPTLAETADRPAINRQSTVDAPKFDWSEHAALLRLLSCIQRDIVPRTSLALGAVQTESRRSNGIVAPCSSQLFSREFCGRNKAVTCSLGRIWCHGNCDPVWPIKNNYAILSAGNSRLRFRLRYVRTRCHE